MSSHTHCASFLLPVPHVQERNRETSRYLACEACQWTARNLGYCEVKFVSVCKMFAVWMNKNPYREKNAQRNSTGFIASQPFHQPTNSMLRKLSKKLTHQEKQSNKIYNTSQSSSNKGRLKSALRFSSHPSNKTPRWDFYCFLCPVYLCPSWYFYLTFLQWLSY